MIGFLTLIVSTVLMMCATQELNRTKSVEEEKESQSYKMDLDLLDDGKDDGKKKGSKVTQSTK